jgi:hypothetical protein
MTALAECPKEDLVLIYSIEHGQYWKADSCGYTSNRDFAGRYPRVDAQHICKMANRGVPVGCELNEVIEEIDLTPKKYVSDHVSKKALREWCEEESKRCKKEETFAGLGEATGYQEVINKFCGEE